MPGYDWSRFVVRVNVHAPMQTLYAAWATREGIESWFLRLSEYRKKDGSLREHNDPVQPGDTYKWLWHGWPDDTVEHGQLLEANGKDRLSFSFGEAGNCIVSLGTEEDEPIVELEQENIPGDEHGHYHWHLGCKTGWTFYLANLKSILEGGIDLRNKNVKLQQMINA